MSGALYLGTPRLIADETQKTVWRWDNQEPFGNDVPNEDPDGDGQAFAFNLRFPGQYFDKETGLLQNWFRDYDANIGRYAVSDPLGLAGGLNTYSYVGADVLSSIDISGLAKACAGLTPESFSPANLPPNCRTLFVDSGNDQDINTAEEELESIFGGFRWKNPKIGIAPEPKSLDPRNRAIVPPVKPEIQVDWYALYRKLIRTTVTLTYQPWVRYEIHCESKRDCQKPPIRYSYQKTYCSTSWSKTNESTGWIDVEKFLFRASIDWFLP